MTFVGVPADSVGRSEGAELAPAALRDLGLPGLLGGDAGDLGVRIRGEERDTETGILAAPDVLATTRAVRGAVERLVSSGERPFLAGGCCSLVPGALAGARDALGTVGLAYLDGHLDLYDGRTSPTGEAADMPVSVALGIGPAGWVEAAGGASIAPERTAIVAHRDQEESRRYGMRQPETLGADLTHPSLDEVRAEGAGAVAARIAAQLAARAPYWVHLDVDVLDRDLFPATDYLMPGGMSWDELGLMLAPLLASPGLIGASVACYNPEKDDPERSCGRRLVDAVGSARDAG